jgi:hypothetical protein
MMDTLEVGQKLVTHSNADRSDLAVDELYAQNIVSIEPSNSVQGLAAVRDKHSWWNDNNDVHSSTAEGPYIGHQAHKFVVKFAIDVTPKGASRVQFEELGIYTVADGKVVKEEFLSLGI